MLHDLLRQAVRHLARAGVAETARAQRDAGVAGQLFHAPVVERRALPVVKADRHRAAALEGIRRAVQVYQRLPAAVAHGGQPVDQPAGQAGDPFVDLVNAHRLQVAQADLDRRDVQVIHRAVFETGLAGDQVMPVPLHRGDGDGATGVPGPDQLCQRGAAGQQAAHPGRIPEHLVEGDGHEIWLPAGQVETVAGDEGCRVDQHVPPFGAGSGNQLKRVLHAAEIGLRRKGKQVVRAGAGQVQVVVNLTQIQAQFRGDDGQIGELGAFLAGILPNPVDRIVVVESQQVVVAGAKRV